MHVMPACGPHPSGPAASNVIPFPLAPRAPATSIAARILAREDAGGAGEGPHDPDREATRRQVKAFFADLREELARQARGEPDGPDPSLAALARRVGPKPKLDGGAK